MNEKPEPKTKFNPWPYALAGFLGVFFLSLVGYVFFAVSNSMELVSENYYEQEVAFQNQIDRAQRALDFDQRLTIERDSSGNLLNLLLPKETSGLQTTGTIHLYRPSNAALDFQLPLNPDSANTQIINTTGLQSGLWRIKVAWEVDGEEYYFEDMVVL